MMRSNKDYYTLAEIQGRGWISEEFVRDILGAPTRFVPPPSGESRRRDDMARGQAWDMGAVHRAERTPEWQARVNAVLEAERAERLAAEAAAAAAAATAEAKKQAAIADGTYLPVNGYGNVDITDGLPYEHLIHVEPSRPKLCARLGIACAPALVEWEKYRGRPSPVVRGMVICRRDHQRLIDALAAEAAAKPDTAQVPS